MPALIQRRSRRTPAWFSASDGRSFSTVERQTNAALAVLLIGTCIGIGLVARRRQLREADGEVAEEATSGRTETSLEQARTVGKVAGKSARIATTLAGMVLACPSPRNCLRVLLAGCSAFGVEYALKGLFDRPRPPKPLNTEDKTSPTYPSGHAMCVVIPWTIAGSLLESPERDLARAASVVVTSTSAAARVYAGVHWPSDIIGGAALGVGLGCAIDALLPPE